MKQSRSFLFAIFRFQKLNRILGGGNGNKTASYGSVDYPLVVPFGRFLAFWVCNVYQLVAMDLLGRFLAFVGVVGVWVVVEMKRIRGSSQDRRSCNWDLLNVTFLRIRQ